jgi:pyruvate dehydrogenase E2 component (dihydrolipoamide acetyltransferase)
MAIDVPMPKLGLTMEEAMIIDWLVEDGAMVEKDQPILMIETDKTETEVGAPGDGRLHQLGKPGDVFPCGELIGWLLAEGEEPPAAPTAATPAATTSSTSATAAAPAAPSAQSPVAAPVTTPGVVPSTGRLVASPNARRVAAELGVDLRMVRGTGPGGRIVSEDVEAAPASVAGRSSSLAGFPVVATAAARQLADLLGLDLAAVPPDPSERRITREGVALHVRGLLQQATPAPPAPPAPAVPATAPAVASPPTTTSVMPLLQEPVETIRMSGMRGTIAKRMHASLQEMAQLTLTMDADMTAVLADRADRKSASPDTAVPSITDYIVAAAARALPLHPRMNAQVTDSGIAVLPEVHVGLAVAVDNGLMVPVVRDAADRELSDLAAETSRLAAACRSGSISPAELEGGTFSVSALGAFGVDAFTPVINPPNVGILGVGRLRDDLVLVDGAVSTLKRLTLSLTWDHRVVDGVPAAEFCRTVVTLLADPPRLT